MSNGYAPDRIVLASDLLGHSWPVPDALREPRVFEQMLDNRHSAREELAASCPVSTTFGTNRAVTTVVGIAVTIETTIEQVGDLRIHLTGELDAWSKPTLTHALTDLRPPARAPGQRRGHIVLDLHELNFMDVNGLCALDESRSALVADGWVVTAGPAQRQVCWLLRYAARSGWLADGPLVAEDSTAAHLHAPSTSRARRRRPQSVSSVNSC